MTEARPPRRRREAAVALAVAGAVVCGALVATQSRINGQLGAELGDGYLAALISFGSGFALLVVIAALHRRTRHGIRSVLGRIRSGSTPWWYTLGGLAGALFVLSQSLTAALLGVALFTVATVTGQTLSGLLVDRTGLGAMGPKPVSGPRIAGAALAVLAVAVAVLPEFRGGADWWVLVLPVAAGLMLGYQQAVNGQLREISGSALTATFFNFMVGTTALAVAFVVHLAVGGRADALPANPLLYLGGVIGVVFIAGYAIVVRFTGVLVLGLGAVSGQLIASLVFDLALPVADRPLQWTTAAGTVGTLVAVLLAAIPAAPSARRPR